MQKQVARATDFPFEHLGELCGLNWYLDVKYNFSGEWLRFERWLEKHRGFRRVSLYGRIVLANENMTLGFAAGRVVFPCMPEPPKNANIFVFSSKKPTNWYYSFDELVEILCEYSYDVRFTVWLHDNDCLAGRKFSILTVRLDYGGIFPMGYAFLGPIIPASNLKR